MVESTTVSEKKSGEIIEAGKEFDFLSFKKAFEDHIKHDLELKVLVCGRTGVGKSSLVNTLVGREVFRASGPGDVSSDDSDDDGFAPATTDVRGVTVYLQDVLLHVYDSPGLQDGTASETVYLEEMYQKCNDASLVLYCVDMTAVRWLPAETNAINLLTEKFGEEFWNKSVLVLTKCNMLQPRDPNNARQYVKKAYDNFVKRFRKQLVNEAHVAREIAENIPAVATGSRAQRRLHYVSSNADPSTRDFLPELWITCVERLSGRARGLFVQVTSYRGRFRLEDDRPPEYEEVARIIAEEEAEYRRHIAEERERMKRIMTEEQWRDIEAIRRQREEGLSRYRRDLVPLQDSEMTLNQNQLNRYRVLGVAGGGVTGVAAGAAIGISLGGILGIIGGPIGIAIGASVGAAVGAAAGGTLGGTLGGAVGHFVGSSLPKND